MDGVHASGLTALDFLIYDYCRFYLDPVLLLWCTHNEIMLGFTIDLIKSCHHLIWVGFPHCDISELNSGFCVG